MPASFDLERELTIFDIARFVGRWKWLISAAVIVFLGLGVLYLKLATPIYEAVAVVEIGIKKANDPIENLDTMLSRLSLLHNLNERSLEKRPYPRVDEFSVLRAGKKDSDFFLKIAVEGTDPATVQAFAKQLADGILKDLRSQYDSIISLEQVRIQTMREVLTSAHGAVKELDQRGLPSPREGDMTSLAFIFQQSSFQQNIVETQNLLSDRELLLRDLENHPPALAFEPDLPDEPARPSRPVVLAIMFILGTIAGAAISLILELRQREKQLPAKQQATSV